MRSNQQIEQSIRSLHVETGAARREQTLRDLIEAHVRQKEKTQALSLWSFGRTIMMSKAGRLTAAAVVVGAVLFLVFFGNFTEPAWGLTDAIAAIKGFRAVYVVGTFPGGTAEIWMRANEAKTQSARVVVKDSYGGITWTRDGVTYHYEPSQNTVYYEHAVTIGMAQWLGPELLETLGTAENVKIRRGKDPATGRPRIILLSSLVDVNGAQSWRIEFDVASKLPVAIKQWRNLDRSGPPAFDASEVVYYEDLADSVFEVEIPGDPIYVEKPLTIPDENIGLLSDPHCGMVTEGLTQQEAAEQVLHALFQAIIDEDLARLKQLCPICTNWGDEFLRSVILRVGQDNRVAEIVTIGPICATGRSKIGPIAAVPVTVRLKNGKSAEQKLIVQFRELADESSCVVHGPYGHAREIE
jgi:hypothetical protein